MKRIPQGEKIRQRMLHVALSNKESYRNWLDFLRDVIRRGLLTPLMITTDGAPGLIRAVEKVFAESLPPLSGAQDTQRHRQGASKQQGGDQSGSEGCLLCAEPGNR